MAEIEIGGIPVTQRVMDAALRKAAVFHPDMPPLLPEHLSVAYRALADFTLLLYAYDYRRDADADSDGPFDVATRYGRFMHLLADLFRDMAREEH